MGTGVPMGIGGLGMGEVIVIIIFLVVVFSLGAKRFR